MRQDVKLYINDSEVYFRETPEINFTYQQVDYTSPAAVKNSYTKELEVEGVPQNNRIFNSIFRLDRVNSLSDGYFNPAKRVPFQLFHNGDLVEQGYCKLNEVINEGGKITYLLTLFGGLGEFFYSLSYCETDNPDEGGNELTLADLTYRNDETGEDIDLDFTINKETVASAWTNLGERNGYIKSKWDIINIVPCYNGYPEALDADRVLVDVRSSSSITMRTVVDNVVATSNGFPTNVSGFTPYNGRYAFVKADGDFTDLEMKDLRSYLQRPCVSVLGLFNGIKNSTKFDVQLDPNFFVYDNPYYGNAHFTLPLLSNLETESSSITATYSIADVSENTMYDWRFRLGIDAPLYEGVTDLSVSFTPLVDYKYNPGNTERQPSGGTKFYTSFSTGKGEKNQKVGAVTYQLIGYDGNNSAVAGSDIYVCTSKVERTNWTSSKTLSEMGFESVFGAVPVYDYGYFVRGSKWGQNGYECKWYKPVTLRLSTNSTDVKYVVLRVNWVNYKNEYRGCLSPTNGKPDTIFKDKGYNFLWVGRLIQSITPVLSGGSTTVSTPSSLCSNARVTKKMLLSSLDASPCDLLLSYCKLFNLYFEKDLHSDTVYIRWRGNFYDGETKNLEKLIDRKKEMTLTPLSFENKWYAFNYDEGEGKYLESYKDKYSAPFGQQKVDTGYNFDSSVKEVLEDNSFVNAVSTIENSPYFHFWRTNGNDEIGLPPFLFNQKVTYSLFSGNENKDIDVLYPADAAEGGFNSECNYLDAFDRLQLRDKENSPVDGAGVLVFFNGYNDEKDYDDNHLIWFSGQSIPSPIALTYRITDDVQEMIDLNGKPTWLWTQDNSLGLPVTLIPHFSRYTGYKDVAKNYIGFAWDFGYPKELYIPEKRYSATSPIYQRFWKKYISDLYDQNTRRLKCYVKMEDKVIGNWLKHFYWFDNSLWVLEKVTDYDITSFETVLCEFVKVWDKTAYTDNISFAPILTVTPSTTTIPASGGTVTVEVYISDSGSWGSDYDPGKISADIDSSSGGVETTVVTLTFAANTGSSRTVSYTVTDSYDHSVSVIFFQEGETQLNLNPSVLTLDYDSGATGTITITSDGDYNISINDN